MITWIVLSILAIAVFAAVVVQHHKSALNYTPSFENGWHILYSENMPGSPIMTGTGSWTFDFPAAPGHVDYMQNYSPPQLEYGKTLTMKFSVTGSGFVAQADPSEKATVTLMLEQKGDPGTDQGQYDNYRQYSSNVVDLAAGVFTISAILDENHFGNINGQHDKEGFINCLNNLLSLGPVFGSASLRGHGVYADEPSTFSMISIECN